MQKWSIVKVGTSYRIRTFINPTYALDRSTAKNSENNAHLYNSSESSEADQLVEIFEQDGYYKIKLASDNLYLTVSNCHIPVESKITNSNLTTASSNVYWATLSSSEKQKWTLKKLKDEDSTPSNMATSFPKTSFYSAANALYPNCIGECTWYCLGRAHEKFGIKNLPTGNANTWYQTAKNWGYEVTEPSERPVANSIAVWTKGKYGHVAFVESVSGNNVTISEANWYAIGDSRLSNDRCETPPEGTDGELKIMTIEKFRSRYAPFAGCIKLQ